MFCEVVVLGGGGGVLPMALKHLVIRPSVVIPYVSF